MVKIAKTKKPKPSKPETVNKAVNGVTQGEYSAAPYVDKFPYVIGSRLTLNQVSSIMKQSTAGNRYDYVNLLNELRERDQSGLACLQQRVISVTSSEFTVREQDYITEEQKPVAEKIANFVRVKLHQIHGFKMSLQELQWAIYYGITGQEITWEDDYQGYRVPTRLNLIHPARLEYPVQSSWDLYIIDRGMGFMNGGADAYGIKVEDYPGKFLIHTARLMGDYPTRDGLGRALAIPMTLKSMALRSASQTIERFAKPWAIAYYNTKSEENRGNPRIATVDIANSDVSKAELALQALGTGAMTYAVLPDSVELKPQENLTGSFTAELPQTIFMKFLDQQIARVVLTTDEFTIAAGVGSQAKAEVLKRNLMQIMQYDADNLAETLTRDLIRYMVEWNFYDDLITYGSEIIPKLVIQVQDAPNLEQLVKAAEQAFKLGADINIQRLCDAWDIPLTDDPLKKAKGRPDPDEQLKADTQKEISDKTIAASKETAKISATAKPSAKSTAKKSSKTK
jgi:phage gp29-like protein